MDASQLSPEQMAQIDAMKKQILNKVLSKEAYERLARVRVVEPQLAMQIELYFMQLYQSGQLKEQVSEEQLKKILSLFTQEKKQTKIMRR